MLAACNFVCKLRFTAIFKGKFCNEVPFENDVYGEIYIEHIGAWDVCGWYVCVCVCVCVCVRVCMLCVCV